MNPVQIAIRDYVDNHYADWRRRKADVRETRAGLRYLGMHVADLLAPALDAVGLRLAEDLSGRRRFVTDTGRHVPRDKLAALVAGALAGHPDPTLRESASSDAFFTHLGDRLEQFDDEGVWRASGASVAAPAPSAITVRESRGRRWSDESESASAWLKIARPRFIGTRVLGKELFLAAQTEIAEKVADGRFIHDGDDSPLWAVPRRRVFYAAADQEYVRAPRGGGGTAYLVEASSRTAARLSPRAAETLRVSGVLKPERFADQAVAQAGEPGPAPRPSLTVDAANSLPFALAAGVALANDPRRAFVRLSRLYRERSPGTATAISEAARVFGDDLVSAARHRVATAIAAEAPSRKEATDARQP